MSRERLGPSEADFPEADTNRVNKSDTSQILKGHEVFVSHKWDRAADKASKDAEKQSAKRVVQPCQVTNIQSMGNVYRYFCSNFAGLVSNSSPVSDNNLLICPYLDVNMYTSSFRSAHGKALSTSS